MKNKIYKRDVEINKYIEEFTNFSHLMDKKEKNYLQKKDPIFKKNFKVLTGLNDIYEWYTGAVFFKDYEWNELKNSKLKQVFAEKNNKMYKYILFLDDGVILRGADIYYYFLTYLSRFKPTVKEDIIGWYNNVKCFLNKVLGALKSFEINDYYDVRLLLGTIDNIRNVILLLYNCELLLDNNENNFLITSEYNNQELVDYTILIKKYQEYINKCCFERPLDNKIINEVRYLIIDGIRSFDKTIKKVLNSNSSYIFNKGFNRLRENDHYFENYYTCEYVFSKIKKYDNINLIGLMYGALELPFIVKYNNLSKSNITIGLLNQEEGNYFVKQQNSVKKVNDELCIKGNIEKSNISYIIDDNLMSGVTAQNAIDLLGANSFLNIKGVIAIRRPSLYRISQLKFYNNYLNIDLYNKKIFGLLTKSSYTRIKDNTNYGERFSNELNICSIQSEIFLKALYCNNSYVKDSEVDIFTGFNNGV